MLDGTAFCDHERPDGSGKRDIYFSDPSDGHHHGHAVQSADGDDVIYHYVRDVDGNVYVDRRGD
jgi:hypothetical protein